jgi:hypothetical protein
MGGPVVGGCGQKLITVGGGEHFGTKRSIPQ